MPPFARASSLDRLLKCAGSEILGGVDAKSSAALVAANWGTMVHAWKETGDVDAPPGYENLEPLFRKKLADTKVKHADWWPEEMVHEAAISIDVVNKRYELKIDGTKEEKDTWKASQSADCITGTCDGYYTMFGRLHVDDLKTGREVSLEAYESQLLYYSLGIARATCYNDDIMVSLTHWPRYPVSSQPRRLERIVTQAELLQFEQRLAQLHTDIKSRNIEYNVGEHCVWCPSRTRCEARTQNLSTIHVRPNQGE